LFLPTQLKIIRLHFTSRNMQRLVEHLEVIVSSSDNVKLYTLWYKEFTI
jgi:hypothetical protein